MRCPWAEHSEIERDWHDTEWGRPLRDERLLFELLVLKGAQAGLAWRTVLAKRKAYREVFHDYDIDRVTWMSDDELSDAVANRGIIRHRLKIASVRSNACIVQDMARRGESLSTLLWSFTDGTTQVNRYERPEDVPMRTETSDRMSQALRAKGFRFAGTAICYGIMQAAGMVNDHLVSCDRYAS